MAKLSPWSPYVLEFYPSILITGPRNEKVAEVDTVYWLEKGYRQVVFSQEGMGFALPESVVYPKRAIVDYLHRPVAIVMGVGKVYPPYKERSVTPAEAALSGQFDRKLAPVVVAPTRQIRLEVERRYPGQHPLFVRSTRDLRGR